MLAKDHDKKEEGKPQGLPLTSSSKTAFEKVQLARHNDRPYTIDFITRLFQDFVEIYGDRRFSNDPAIICGFANFHGIPVAVVGHQKGRDTKQRQFRNFGMPKPEGYRKALRVMKLAEKFGRIVLSFIDTPGAYPGIDAEERGQAEAIAYNLREMAKLKVPVIATIIGEGGSGGALAIGLADHVLMLENAIYSVISPEGCASILWKDTLKSDQAAASLRLTAADLFREGLIDSIVAEPPGGAHMDHNFSAKLLDTVLKEKVFKLAASPKDNRVANRYQKLQLLGKWGTAT